MKKLFLSILFLIFLCSCGGGGTSSNNSPTPTSQNVPTELVATKTGNNTITLSWQAPLSTSGALTRYNIYRNGNLIATVSSADSSVSYLDSSVSFSQTYTYAVSSFMNNGIESSLSGTSIVNFPLSPPTNLAVVSTTLFSIKFSWVAPVGSTNKITSYNIYRDGVLVAINSPTDISYNDDGLIPSTTYSYTVVASSNTGDSDPSTPLAISTLSPGTTIASPVRGVIIDPATGDPLQSVVVSCHAQSTGALVAQATTDASGQYTFTGLILGMTYYLDFSVSGFDTSVRYYNIIPYTDNLIPSASPLFLQPVRLVQSALASQTSSLTGFVKNATNNSGLANMTVKIRQGISNQTGTVLVTSTTDSTGLFTFPVLPLGTYTAEVTGLISGTSIVKTFATLLNYSNFRNADIAVSLPVYSANGAPQYRIILSWGSNPSDLDSHLTGPTSTGTRFHVYYVNKVWPLLATGTDREVFLDVDNTVHGTLVTSNNGPETTTILIPRIGVYNFYIHHFAGVSNITSSAASVNLYKGNRLLRTFYAPLGAVGVGDVWSVFSMNIIDFNTESITTIGTLSKISTGSLP